MAATRAGMPRFSRRKSIWRYCFLWPPPRCQLVISPCELRPPERFLDSTKDFSGVCLVTSLLSSMVMKRLEAVYGLKLFSAIAACLLPAPSLVQFFRSDYLGATSDYNFTCFLRTLPRIL